MDTILIKGLQLIIALALLIILHEGGHFFAAKIFKVRVEKFYLFFDWRSIHEDILLRVHHLTFLVTDSIGSNI